MVRTPAEMRRALSIRRAVFIQEQGVPEEEELDEHDVIPDGLMTSIHVLGVVEEMPVATGRLLREKDERGYGHIGRVAVRKDERGKGYGTAIMQLLQGIAYDKGFEGITLASQLHAIPFYERLGYVARGDIFLDAGIEHRWMDLDLRF
jgi:predicted GNAT family N-acyltransferase